MIPVYSQNKKPWGGGSDALSMYFATTRRDFTFRTKMFGSFPKVARPHSGFKAKVGRQYQFEATIEDS